MITIQMEGKPLDVQTYVIGDKQKKTLVLIHGYSIAAVGMYKMLKPLS